MFKMFPFKIWGTINIENLSGMVESFFNDIDLYNSRNEFDNDYEEEFDEVNEDNAEFIKLEEDDDTYILTIELTDVDLRQTSIQYNPGIISINLNKFEKVTQHTGMFPLNYMMKKNYKKEFNNIESVDESKIMKILENNILTIYMPKKYTLNKDSKIIDVQNYIENKN